MERALVHSFLMPFEERHEKSPCSITGCDHRVGDCEVQTGRSGAYVGTEKIGDVYGVACGCCVNKILNQEEK